MTGVPSVTLELMLKRKPLTVVVAPAAKLLKVLVGVMMLASVEVKVTVVVPEQVLVPTFLKVMSNEVFSPTWAAIGVWLSRQI